MLALSAACTRDQLLPAAEYAIWFLHVGLCAWLKTPSVVTPVSSRAGLVHPQKWDATHMALACSSVRATWPAGAGAANKSYTNHSPRYLPIADWRAACSAGARLTVLLGLRALLAPAHMAPAWSRTPVAQEQVKFRRQAYATAICTRCFGLAKSQENREPVS